MNRDVRNYEIEVSRAKLAVWVKRGGRYISANAIRQALKVIFGVADIKVPTNMIPGAPDPWAASTKRTDITAWENRRRGERQGAVIAAYLYLYFYLKGERFPVIAAHTEEVRKFVPDDLLTEIWDALEISSTERAELVTQ